MAHDNSCYRYIIVGKPLLENRKSPTFKNCEEAITIVYTLFQIIIHVSPCNSNIPMFFMIQFSNFCVFEIICLFVKLYLLFTVNNCILELICQSNIFRDDDWLFESRFFEFFQ